MIPSLIVAAAVTDFFSAAHLNLALNIAAIVLIVYFGPKYLRNRDMQAQLSAKDGAIATDRQSIESLETRVETLDAEAASVREALAHCEVLLQAAQHEATQWRARYEEQSKYTAQPAIEQISTVLGDHIEAVQARHASMIKSLDEISRRLSTD